MRPIVTWLTDFGLKDTFVGQMKGVVLSRCPDAQLIDLTHDVPPQEVLTGAIHLRAAWHWFPEGSIHVAVVDPGVGSERRAIAFEFMNHTFIGPDNGLLTALLAGDTPACAVELSTDDAGISRTFHGRDVFAVAAGRIASGETLASVGTEISPATLSRITIPEPSGDSHSITGVILLIDHYGNAITNITEELFRDRRDSWTVRCSETAHCKISNTYAEVKPGELLALISSMNTLEIAVRDGSAADMYDLSIGMQVRLDIHVSDQASKEATS